MGLGVGWAAAGSRMGVWLFPALEPWNERGGAGGVPATL